LPVQNGWKDVVTLLLERGADPNAALEDGSTPIIAASFGGYHEIVEVLIRADKSCLDARFKNGSTPLMTAALNGFLSVVKVLLAHNANVSSLNDDNWSALAVAAQKGCLQICRLLIEAGAPVETTTDRGYTPLMLAVKSGYLEIAQLLVQHGAAVNHFTIDETTGALETQKIPLLYGYLSPLMLAINRGELKLMQYLLSEGADVHLDLAALMGHCNDPKDKYTAAQHEALKKAAREAEETEAKCRTDMERGEPTHRLVHANAFRTAQTACEAAFRKLELFQEEQTLQHEALKDATLVYTYFGTPLLFAVYWGHVEMMRAWLQHEAQRVDKEGANIGDVRKMLAQVNTNGQTPLDLAMEYGVTDVVDVLLQYGAPLPSAAVGIRFAGKMLYRWRAVTLVKVLGRMVYEATRRRGHGQRDANDMKLKSE
jgi:ankyrin repeat protein